MSDSTNFSQVTGQIREFTSGLTTRQRMLLGGGAALVLVVLFTFVHLLSKPEMTSLYSNLEPADAQSLGQRLTAKNIRYQLSPDGRSVLVPADQVESARLEIADNGAPSSGRMGFEIFDKTNWAASDFDDKVNYQRGLEGELERTIQAMSGVAAARVHLALPPDSIYSEQDRQAKAGVILKLKGHRLDAALCTSVQRLVASAVDKLDPHNVTVVDADAGTTAGELSASDDNGHTSDAQLAAQLIRTLEPVVGADHVRATVHTEFDPSTVEEQQESYDPDKTVALTMQRTEESNGGTQPGGAAGTASNVPGGGTPAKASSDSLAMSKSENGTYAVNKVVRHSIEPAGRLKRLAVAVVVDDAPAPGGKEAARIHRTPEELKSLEEIAKASVGFDAARGDILTVQNISFHGEPVEAPLPPTRWQKVQTTAQHWSGYFRTLTLLALFAITYLIVLRPVKKQLLHTLREGATRHALPANAQAGLGGAEGEEASLPLGERERNLTRLKGDIAARVKKEPAGASRLVQSWMREGERS